MLRLINRGTCSRAGISVVQSRCEIPVQQTEIGGKYSTLADTFIIAVLKPDAARTKVIEEGYKVEQ